MTRRAWVSVVALTVASAASIALADAAGGGRPVRSGDVFVYSDGVRVRATDPSGHTGTVGNDGSISWADGTSFSHDVKTGEMRITRSDGGTTVTNSHAPQEQDGNFVYPDGTRVRATDPSGQTGTVKSDGSIVYSDGTRVTHDGVSGDTKFVHPDGHVDVIGRNTPTASGGSFVYSDGTRVRATDPSGQMGVIKPDGTIVYSDGTTASHDVVSGETKFVSPDGSVQVLGPNRPTSQDGNFTYSRSFFSWDRHQHVGKGRDHHIRLITPLRHRVGPRGSARADVPYPRVRPPHRDVRFHVSVIIAGNRNIGRRTPLCRCVGARRITWEDKPYAAVRAPNGNVRLAIAVVIPRNWDVIE